MSESTPTQQPASPGPHSGPSEQGDGMREVALVKNGQRYVFRYAPGDEARLIASLADMARDPKCELGWFDAAVLSHQMGRGMEQELQKRLKV